jgi:protein SCO1/2
MKFILIPFLAFVIGITSSFSQNDQVNIEVGIIEHLGDTIPLDLKFYNTENDTVTLGELITKPTVLSFVYFDCPGLCSPLLDGVADVVSKTDVQIGEVYDVITISFNTKDTPEKAKEKKKNFVTKIGEENQDAWYYLTGEEENIKAITNAVGFMYKPQGVDFAHPSAIIVVSPQGKITRYLYGIDFLPFDLKMAVTEAQTGIERPTINKVLQYCFAYDPKSQGYTLQITKVLGTFIIAVAIILFTVLLLKRRKSVKK